MEPILSAFDVERYVVACCGRVGVKVTWENEGVPRTDGRTMWLPIPPHNDAKAVVRIMQFVKHETSHLQYSDFDVLEKYRPNGLLMMVMNLIEDHRVDWLNDTEFKGDLFNSDTYMEMWFNEAVLPAPLNDDNKNVVFPLFGWDADARNDLWNNTDIANYLCKNSNKDVLSKLMKFSGELRVLRNNTHPVSSAAANYDMSCRILREVFNEDPAAHQNPPEKGNGDKSKEKGDKSDGHSDEGTDGDESDCSDASSKEGKGSKGKGEAEGEAKDSESGDGEGEDKYSDKEVPTKTIDLKGEELGPYSAHTNRSGGINMKNYSTGSSVGTYKPDRESDMYVHNFSTGIGTMGRLMSGRSKVVEGIKDSFDHATNLANILRTKLQIFSKDRVEYGRKSGKIQASALWKTQVKEAKGYSERIFKKQIRNDTLDICIQLVVDASGSMQGSKFRNAAAAACILNDTLSQVLHVPVEILAFTECSATYGVGTRDEVHTIFVMKEFAKNRSSHIIAKDFGVVSEYLQNNVDGESLAFAYNRISKRKEKRKLMIVLSDGSPAGGYTKGNISRYTKDVIQAIEKSNVEIIGVGIAYDAVKTYYKDYDTIEHAKDIESSLLRILNNKLFSKGV